MAQDPTSLSTEWFHGEQVMTSAQRTAEELRAELERKIQYHEEAFEAAYEQRYTRVNGLMDEQGVLSLSTPETARFIYWAMLEEADHADTEFRLRTKFSEVPFLTGFGQWLNRADDTFKVRALCLSPHENPTDDVLRLGADIIGPILDTQVALLDDGTQDPVLVAIDGYPDYSLCIEADASGYALMSYDLDATGREILHSVDLTTVLRELVAHCARTA